MHAYRSHTCADLTKDQVGDTVRLAGWVHRIRDHGGVLFIDLRDHYGVTQVLCDPDSPVFSQVEKVRSEWCIRIDGNVKARAESLVNPKLPTGEIEVYIRDIEVLGEAQELPLIVFGDQEYPEETRLKYRYLDLRREAMQTSMTLRSDVVASIRRRMWDKGFREYQTPIITASSPEGARDFLVPSRLHPGKFYALPQAPQQFKQLIMVSGFDKYFQIAPCFRDEDPRADRSPTDFYQLDMEMSFVEQQDVFDTIQPVLTGIFEDFGGGRKVDQDWPQISYKDAALWYGTDKPDLRNPIKMQVVSEHFKGSGFAIFAKLLEQDGTEIRAIPAPGGGSRKFCDRMNKFAQEQGLPGMGYIFWRDQGEGMEAAGPLAKNIGPERTEAIRQQLGLEVGDAAFFLGGFFFAFIGILLARRHIGRIGGRGVAFGLLERRRSDQRGDGEVAIGDRAFAAFRQRQFADVDRIADFLAGNVDFDFARDLVGFADQFQLVADDVENAALLEARRSFFIDEDDRNADFDLRTLGEAEEVGVLGAVGDRMERHVLGERAEFLAAQFDLDDRVHEVAGVELLDQLLGFNMDQGGFFLAAVDYGGDTAIAAKLTGGSLASPFARLGRQGQSVAHVTYLSNAYWLLGPPRLQG